MIKIMNDFSQYKPTIPEWVYYNRFQTVIYPFGYIFNKSGHIFRIPVPSQMKDPAIHAGPHSVFDTVRLPRLNVHHCRLMLDRLYRCLNYMMCSFFTAFSFLVFVSKYLVSDLTIIQFFVNYRLFYQIFN